MLDIVFRFTMVKSSKSEKSDILKQRIESIDELKMDHVFSSYVYKYFLFISTIKMHC